MSTMNVFGKFTAEVKNIKINKGLSRDSLAFTCKLYINKKYVADCADTGFGRGMEITYINKKYKDIFDEFTNYIESQKVPGYDFNSNLDIAVGDMINQYEYECELKRKMTYNLVFEKVNKSDCFSVSITPKTNLAKVVTIPAGVKCLKNMINKYTTGKYSGYKCINTNIDVNKIMQ